MTIITKQKNRIKVKPFIFGVDPQPTAELKVGVTVESGGTQSTQLASLVLSLIKFELIRRNAFSRWRMYLNQVGLRLNGLIAYLNVLSDDEELINSLKAYYYKSKDNEYSKIELLREANELRELLTEKIEQFKVLSDFQVHRVPVIREKS